MTKRISKFLLAVALATAFFSCEDEDLCLIGSGTAHTYPLELADFTAIGLQGPVNLEITQGTTQAVEVVAEPEMFEALDYSVKSGTLIIGYEGNVSCFETDHGVWINITLPELSSIAQSGISEIVSNGELELDVLVLSLEGESKVEITGTVGAVAYNIAGLTDVNCFELETEAVSINLAGEGDFEVSCSRTLNLNVAGAAVVRYKGTPQITQNVQGTLELIDSN